MLSNDVILFVVALNWDFLLHRIFALISIFPARLTRWIVTLFGVAGCGAAPVLCLSDRDFVSVPWTTLACEHHGSATNPPISWPTSVRSVA